jgi:hypothetical protein
VFEVEKASLCDCLGKRVKLREQRGNPLSKDVSANTKEERRHLVPDARTYLSSSADLTEATRPRGSVCWSTK